MQDPNVAPWGALDRYQAHFLVSIPDYNERAHKGADVFARTKLETSGHFAAKRVESVSWEGPSHPLLVRLNQDAELNEMIARQSVWDAAVSVEQTGENIRIHGRWRDGASFGIGRDMFEIYDRIAGHVRESCLPPVK